MRNQSVTLFDRIQAHYLNAQKNESSCFFFATCSLGLDAGSRQDIFDLIKCEWDAIKQSRSDKNLDLQLLNATVSIVCKENYGMAPQFISNSIAEHFNLSAWRRQYRKQFGILKLHTYSSRFKEYRMEYKVSEIEALQTMVLQKLDKPIKESEFIQGETCVIC